MRRFAKLATPATAAVVVVPESVPPPGLAPSATVTLPVKPVAVVPPAACAVTRTAGVMAAPGVRLLGCTVKARWFAAAGATSNGVLVVPVGPVALAVRV